MRKYDKLNQFFERIKNLSFWQRIFHWRPVQNLSYDAFEEYENLISSAEKNEEQLAAHSNKIELLNNDNSHLKAESEKLHAQLKSLDQNTRSLQENLVALNKENAIFKRTGDDRTRDYETRAETLKTIAAQVQNERETEKQKNQEREIQRLIAMKETWSKHQTSVQEVIKMVCQKHTIDYIDQVPFKGKPDNTIRIGDEYIIFDAKSPFSDDLKNFPTYIKTQTESVKKYIKEPNVRKDIFLVIPSNTVDVIDNFSFNMGDYNAYVVTIDVLEPLILALRKIEDYEFVEQLTPEDRENICRIIGKFAHITKRKIQIDFFFTKQLMDVLKKCDANLPTDIMEKVIEYEKSEKINPPRESRSKQILTKDLEAESEIVQSNLKKLPLNENERIVSVNP